MKIRKLHLALSIVALPLLGAAGLYAADDSLELAPVQDNGGGTDQSNQQNRLQADLSGLDAVPSVSTRASGSLQLRISRNGTRITFTLVIRELSAAPTTAQIQFGQQHTNGGAMLVLCGGTNPVACPAATAGLVGTLRGEIDAADVVGPVAQGIDPAPADPAAAAANFAEVIRAIRNGAAYANVITPTFTDGEIRGQVR